MQSTDRLGVDDLAPADHGQRLGQGHAGDLRDDLVVVACDLRLRQAVRHEEVDALVREAGRREDGSEGRQRPCAQPGLLAQLPGRARLRRLVRIVEHASRQLPDEAARGVPELPDQHDAPRVVQSDDCRRPLVADDLEVHLDATRQRHPFDAEVDDAPGVHLTSHAPRHIGSRTGKKARPAIRKAAMNRRAQIALTPEEQREYLAQSHTIILVSNGRHGFPLPVPMWYLVEPDGAVAMTTFRKSQKSLDLRRDPRCTLLVESGRTYPELKGLIIRGRAEIDDDTEHVLDVLETIQRKYNPGIAREGLRDALRGQASKRCVVRVRPERVSSWDHAKLGPGVY